MTTPESNVVTKAPGMWVFEHLAEMGVDEEALEYAAPLLGNDQQVVDATSRLAARLALLSVDRALADDPTLEIDLTHCKLLRAIRDALHTSGVDVETLEREMNLAPLFAGVVIRADDWDAYKKTLDALFPPGTSSGKGPVVGSLPSPTQTSPSQPAGLRPELLATFSRCRSGADEGYLNARRARHGMTGDAMRAAAKHACAVARTRLGEDSLTRIAVDFGNGTYVPSRGKIASHQNKTFRFAKGTSGNEAGKKSPPPRRKTLLTPKKTVPKGRMIVVEKNTTLVVDKRTTRGAGAAAGARTQSQDTEIEADPNDVYDFANERVRDADRNANRAFEALGAAAEAMEAEETEAGAPRNNDDDDDDHQILTDDTRILTPNKAKSRPGKSPSQKALGAIEWRRGGGGAGKDRNGEEESGGDEEEISDDEDVRPTQAAPEDDENAGLLRRVGGLFGLGKSNVKRKRGDGDSDDDDDNAIATSSKKKPKTAAKGGTGKTPGSPQPLGVANRHSKRAVTFANVGALPRKKKVYWTSGETRALEVGVRTLMDTNQFELGNTYDKQTNTLNDKWRKIYEQHKDVFDVNGRTTMDLKDKWRNILKARGGGAGDGAGGAGQGGAAGGGGNVAAAGGTGASPAATTDKSTSWGRALATRLGLARTPSVGGGTGGSTPGGTVTVVPLKRSSTAAPTVPRSPGISNRHSEYRKKLGLSNGVRKKAAKWGADEVAALAAGVESLGEGKWAAIAKSAPLIFLDRTAVDLKDKWRNLKGRQTRLAGQRVPERRVNGDDFKGTGDGPSDDELMTPQQKQPSDDVSDSDGDFAIKTNVRALTATDAAGDAGDGSDSEV